MRKIGIGLFGDEIKDGACTIFTPYLADNRKDANQKKKASAKRKRTCFFHDSRWEAIKKKMEED